MKREEIGRNNVFFKKGDKRRNKFKLGGTIVLARDPPSRHLGRVYDHFDGFWRGGQSFKTLQMGWQCHFELSFPVFLTPPGP